MSAPGNCDPRAGLYLGPIPSPTCVDCGCLVDCGEDVRCPGCREDYLDDCAGDDGPCDACGDTGEVRVFDGVYDCYLPCEACN